jgi:hypothetical protein
MRLESLYFSIETRRSAVGLAEVHGVAGFWDGNAWARRPLGQRVDAVEADWCNFMIVAMA